MQIKCSHCAKILTVPDGVEAAQGKCPHCNQMVDLQAAERIGLAAGDMLGDFRVEQLIGKGGMATVYRGMQVSLERPVAIKLLAPHLARRAHFVQRFGREAKLLAQLSHHNIVGVLAFGSRDDDTHYLVMEYVQGESLRDRLRRDDTIPFDEAAGIIDQVAAGLEYAHNHDVLHRDIKPANILITADGVPKIADFGIARLLGSDSAAKQRLTMAHTRMGSAHYMAPEQMMDAATADHRADIYALGVMFYEMLTGQLPIGQFKPPSRITHGVPVAADRIIRQALAQSADERFQSVAQFRALVQRLSLTGAPTRIQDHRPRAAAHPRVAVSRPPRRKQSPLPMLLGAAIVAAAVVIAVLTLGGRPKTQAVQPPPEKKRGGDSVPRVLWDKEKREEHAKALFSNAVSRFQHGQFSDAGLYLARLDKEGTGSDYYAAHRSAIDQFRRELAAKLGLPASPPAATKFRSVPTLPVPEPAPADAPAGPVHLKAAEADIRSGRTAGPAAKYEREKNCVGHWGRPEDWVRWEFAIHKPGKYEVEVVYAADAGCAGNTYTVRMSTQFLPCDVTPTGGWDTFKSERVGEVKFLRGGPFRLTVRSVQIRPGSSLMNLREIILHPKGE